MSFSTSFSRNRFRDLSISRLCLIFLIVDVESCMQIVKKKIKKQMIECFRQKRVVEEWFYYLIDDEIVRVNVFDLLTNFTTCAFERFLQNDRNLKKKIFVEKRWDRVDERLRQKCIENVENDCCCRIIIRKRYISWKSLLRCVELNFEDWDENKKKISIES
jgi:hypothetical protein